VMAAAVADYTPAQVAPSKMKKSEGVPELKFTATADILKEVAPRKDGRIVVGFAAETDDVVDNARKKLKGKDLDLIVANKVGEPGSGFGSSTDLAAVISEADSDATLTMMSKIELADLLLDRVTGLFK